MPVLSPNLSTGAIRRRRRDPSLPFSADSRHGGAMGRLHLHLISDSTGETLENIAKAAIAQFDDVEVVRHFWPMVRSESHLRSEEHTSELQSLMRTSYAVFCLKKKH